MNKKDCESIGSILAAAHAPEHIKLEFFKLNPRIRGEYDAYAECDRLQDAIEDRMTEILCEKFGPNYGILKACDKELFRLAREQAAKEVYQADEEDEED